MAIAAHGAVCRHGNTVIVAPQRHVLATPKFNSVDESWLEAKPAFEKAFFPGAAEIKKTNIT